MPRFSKWPLPFRLSDNNSVRISQLYHACYVVCASYRLYYDLTYTSLVMNM
jgi:hypothetical protein